MHSKLVLVVYSVRLSCVCVELMRWLIHKFYHFNFTIVCFFIELPKFAAFSFGKFVSDSLLFFALSFLYSQSVVRLVLLLCSWWFEVFPIRMFLAHFYFIPLTPLQKLNWSVSKLMLQPKSPTGSLKHSERKREKETEDEWASWKRPKIHNASFEFFFVGSELNFNPGNPCHMFGSSAE